MFSNPVLRRVPSPVPSLVMQPLGQYRQRWQVGKDIIARPELRVYDSADTYFLV